MKCGKWLILFLVVALTLLTFGGLPVDAAGERIMVHSELGKSRSDYVPDEIVVKFRDDSKPSRVIKVPFGQVKSKVVEYKGRPDVVYAEPNYYAQAFFVPNDPLYRYQWNLDNPANDGIGMEEAWSLSTGANVVVAVLDTGIAYENFGEYVVAPDLAGTSFLAGYDFINNDTHANDDNSHGTHVAGTIAQRTNNTLGVAGVAYNATLMPVKVLDKSGSGTYAAIANGIRWAANNGAKVINMSLGGAVSSSDLLDAVRYAYGKGVTIVAAAGNDGLGTVSYPAAYEEVIAVGATRYDRTLAPYSNYGTAIDVVAPGGDTSVNQNGDAYADGVLQNTFSPTTKIPTSFGYYFFQGTSMAAPHVSGIAALLIARGVATTPAAVKQVLQSTAHDLGTAGWDSRYGAGLVSASRALGWEGDEEPPVEEPARVAKLDLALTTQTVVSGRTTYIQAKADVTVVDANGKPINDAIVTGRWSGAATGTVTGTISDGAVTLFSPQVKKPKKPVTFTLTIDQIKLGDQVYGLTGELKDSVIYTP